MVRKGPGEKSKSRLEMLVSFPVLAKGDVRVGSWAGRDEKFCIQHVAVSWQTTVRCERDSRSLCGVEGQRSAVEGSVCAPSAKEGEISRRGAWVTHGSRRKTMGLLSMAKTIECRGGTYLERDVVCNWRKSNPDSHSCTQHMLFSAARCPRRCNHRGC